MGPPAVVTEIAKVTVGTLLGVPSDSVSALYNNDRSALARRTSQTLLEPAR